MVIGNFNLFFNVYYIIVFGMCIGNLYYVYNFQLEGMFVVNDDVEVIFILGYISEDIFVIVKNIQFGIIVVVGDLFYLEEDMEDLFLWRFRSQDLVCQEVN